MWRDQVFLVTRRTRPIAGGSGEFFVTDPLIGQNNHSFPSGHAMGAFSIAAVLAWSANAPFTDVESTSFAYDDVGRIYGLDITQGTSPTTYSPGDFVTREQMAAFLARLIRILNFT